MGLRFEFDVVVRLVGSGLVMFLVWCFVILVLVWLISVWLVGLRFEFDEVSLL